LVENADRMRLDAPTKQMLLASLRRDAAFLEQHHIIDYSLLVGFHDVAPGEPAYQQLQSGPFFKRYRGGLLSSDGKAAYVMGIIDFLTQYNSRKRMERVLKTVVFMDRNGISVMPARAYAKRFLLFVERQATAA
jgi:1-phosphatidylinositol-4-phosphate 5-kinase